MLFPPELSVLLAEPGQFSPLIAGEQALFTGACSPAIDTGLPYPAGQAAGGKTKPLSDSIAGETLLQAKLHSFRLLMRRKPATRSGGVGQRWTVWWSWHDP
jgi:hypothetical protein